MRRLPPLLRRAWYSLNQAFRQQIAHLGITPDQYSILRWLAESPPEGLTQSELTEVMASDPNTIAATVRRMENAGLVTRPPHETDRRAKRVKLEEPGLKIFKEAQGLALELQESVFQKMPQNEVDLFLELLEKVADACSQLPSGNRQSQN